VYVGLENGDALVAIDTASNTVVGTVPIGQAPQALAYVPNAVPNAVGTNGLVPLGIAGQVVHLALVAVPGPPASKIGPQAPTSVSLFDQGLVQILQASVTGRQPGQPYGLALAGDRSGQGPLQPLAAFTANPAGSAIVDATGPIRQLVQDNTTIRRFLVIAPFQAGMPGTPVQLQRE
jgi:YVTN family beta-propeller protein